jgi:hypothetical protein
MESFGQYSGKPAANRESVIALSPNKLSARHIYNYGACGSQNAAFAVTSFSVLKNSGA